MSKQNILKDIEKLKQANTFLETLFADIRNYKSKEGTSYPVGIPNFSHGDEFQINYNRMCIDILEYFVEKLGDREELTIGKYLRVWFDMYETRLRIGVSLNNEVQSELYNKVFGSWSSIYAWFEKNVLPMLSLITSRVVDFETVLPFFENIGYDVNWNKEKHLSYNKNDYEYWTEKAKELIDDLFKLSTNTKIVDDVDAVLTLYFTKVFENYPDDVEDWF